MKTGRNDPCLCGSGKKYKHCCLSQTAASAPIEPTSQSAQRKAHEYLDARFRGQIHDEVDELLYGYCESEDEFDQVRQALEDMDEGTSRMLSINFNDWLLCETWLERHGERRRGADWALREKTLRLNPAERHFLEALLAAPLRLYEISGIEAGHGFRLRDLHEVGDRPRYVHEMSGSRMAHENLILGARLVVDPDGTLRIGGALYTFLRAEAIDLLAEIQSELDSGSTATATEEGERDEEDSDSTLTAFLICQRWLNQLLAPPSLPDLVAPGGEPLLLIEDEYEVADADALHAVLEAEDDVVGDAKEGWTRLAEIGGEGSANIRSSIHRGENDDRIVLFHRSVAQAEAGREWFTRVANASVRHLEQRKIDPMEMLVERRKHEVPEPSSRPTGLSAEEHTAMIANFIRSHYADWCDAPLPIFEDVSPRAMLATARGRESVRFLLRTYETNERGNAEREQRTPVSYDFLWQQLGLAREEEPQT